MLMAWLGGFLIGVSVALIAVTLLSNLDSCQTFVGHDPYGKATMSIACESLEIKP